MLDGFDFTILTFVLADIQRSFTVDNALAGAFGTVTLMFRLVGGAAAGRRPIGGAASCRSCCRSSGSRCSPCLADFPRPTRSCSRAGRSSASAWEGNGRQGCRWRSNICRIACEEPRPAFFKARGRGVTSFPRSCSRRSILCSDRKCRGMARDVLDRRHTRADRAVDSIEGSRESGVARTPSRRIRPGAARAYLSRASSA